MSSFTAPLVATDLPDGRRRRLVEPFTYYVGAENSNVSYTVPAGFVTDGASAPALSNPWISIAGIGAVILGHNFDFLWLLYLGLAWLLAVCIGTIFPFWSRYGKAAVLHDWLYQSKIVSRAMADLIFKEAMTILKVPAWQITLMYAGVRVFGWLGYSKNNLPKKGAAGNGR
jgi:hypothetical protein